MHCKESRTPDVPHFPSLHGCLWITKQPEEMATGGADVGTLIENCNIWNLDCNT